VLFGEFVPQIPSLAFGYWISTFLIDAEELDAKDKSSIRPARCRGHTQEYRARREDIGMGDRGIGGVGGERGERGERRRM
jgi:hypothetical protein